jgi:hypothetical protein
VARRSLPTLVKQYAEEWRRYHTYDKRNSIGVRSIVFQHLDEIFKGALNTMMGIRMDSFHGVEFRRKQSDNDPTSIMETLIEEHREALAKKFDELLGLAEFQFKPDELRKLRRCYREKLLEKLEENLQLKACEVAETIINHELRHLWMDDETVALVEEKMMGNITG